jgi:hypothetical protein
MANAKQAKARRMNMADRAAALMDIHFPGWPGEWIWRRKTNDGFTTVPRTLPIAMQAIDAQSKGQPAGHTLFCLWARAPDHPLIVIENPATFAGEVGFGGARVVDTWRRRMKFLQKHMFIQAKAGTSGDFHYVLLLNPNAALEWMRLHGHVQDGLYGRFKDRIAEIGAAGEIEALHAFWQRQQEAANAAAKAAAEAAAQAPNPELPPQP